MDKYKKYKCKNDECKISAQTWNGKFGLPNEADSVSVTQDYFEYIIRKKYETVTI